MPPPPPPPVGTKELNTFQITYSGSMSLVPKDKALSQGDGRGRGKGQCERILKPRAWAVSPPPPAPDLLSREALTQTLPEKYRDDERASCTNRPWQAGEMERWGGVFF